MSLSPAVACFDSTVNDCQFDAKQTLASPKLTYKLLCPGRFNGNPEVYLVQVEDKVPALIAYYNSGGSGGVSQSLAIHPPSDRADLCNPADR